MQFCNLQPLPLFPHDIAAATLEARDVELVLCLEALGVRFSSGGILEGEVTRQIQMKTEKASKAIMSRLLNGRVELSTIQTLCLISMLEFTGEISDVDGFH